MNLDRLRLGAALASALVGASFLTAQPETALEAASPITQLRSLIGQVAEKAAPQAADFEAVAQATVETARSALQAGAPLPEPVIRDGLDAVDAGRSLDAEAADWSQIESDLVDLLDPPKPPEQEKPESSEGGEDEQGGQDEQQGDSGKDSAGGQGDSEQQEENAGGSEPEDSPDDPSNSPQDSQNPGDSQEGRDPSESQIQDGAQVGELGDPESQAAPELDEQPEPEEEGSMQTIGGQQREQQPPDARTAAILQKLEQLKQQDQPGKLYRALLPPDELDPEDFPPNNKDW